MVALESDTGEMIQVEVADQWLTLMNLDEGDEWPEDLISKEADNCRINSFDIQNV